MNETEPQEGPTTFAVAIAQRMWQEQERYERRYYELTGQSYKAIPVANRHARIVGIAVKFDDILQDSDFPTEVAQNLFQFALSEIIPYQSPNESTGIVANDISRALSELMVDDDIYSLRTTLKTAEEAKKIASEHGISPEKALEDDSLFEEAVRRTLTAREFTDQAKNAFAKITPENFLDAALIVMLGCDQKNPIPELAAFQESEVFPEVKEKFRIVLEDWRRLQHQITTEKVSRFWPDYIQ
jgi:hypothetical protein